MGQFSSLSSIHVLPTYWNENGDTEELETTARGARGMAGLERRMLGNWRGRRTGYVPSKKQKRGKRKKKRLFDCIFNRKILYLPNGNFIVVLVVLKYRRRLLPIPKPSSHIQFPKQSFFCLVGPCIDRSDDTTMEGTFRRDFPSCVLVDDWAYKLGAFRPNATAASSVTSDGVPISVVFLDADPPTLSHLAVFLPWRAHQASKSRQRGCRPLRLLCAP